MRFNQLLLFRAREKNILKTDLYLTKLQEDLNDFSGKNGTLLVYGWVNIPLVYTQLVTIAVHLYFFVALFGRQYLNPTQFIFHNETMISVQDKVPGSFNLAGYDEGIEDFYVPVFTIIQFMFYFGWLKVAEILINPFGDDDDDFDLNYIVDRNHQVSHIMVDDKDPEENLDDEEVDIPPPTLPHTAASLPDSEIVPVFLTDEIIEEEKENLPEDEPLFVTESRKTSRAPSVMESSPNISGLLNRKNSLRSAAFGSNIILNMKKNLSQIVDGGGGAVMDVIDEGNLEEGEKQSLASSNEENV